MRKSRIQQVSLEVTVGAFMFMVLFVLGMMTIVLSRENWFTTYHHYEVVFDQAMGLGDGDNVLIRGVEAGTVKSLWLAPDGVHVKMSLKEKLDLREDYAVEILPGSLLGGRYVQVFEGSKSAAAIPQDTVLQGIKPIDFIIELSETAEELRGISERLGRGEGTLGRLLVDEDIYANFQVISSNLTEVSERMVSGEGTIGKLLSEDNEIYNNIMSASDSINDLASSMRDGHGTLGKFMTDEELYFEIKALVEEIRAAVDDMRETSPITTFSSVFFGAF